MAKKQIRLLVILSDLHAGSTVALMPPSFETLEGQTIEQSPMQKWLWECWLKCNKWIDGIVGKDPHALVLNGDMIEGIHHHSKQVFSPDTNDHVEAAIHILRDRATKAASSFVIRGTECHTSNTEIVIGKALKLAVNEDTGLPAWDKLFLDVAGVRCVFQHHITTSVRPWTEGTGLASQAASEKLEAIDNDEIAPRVICCAHRHKYGQFSNGRTLTIVSPPWQMLTRHGHKVVGHARTKPGAYILDWRGVENGSLPKVHEILFNAPHPKAITL